MPQIEKTIVEADVLVMEVSGRIVLGRECQVVEWTVESLITDGHKKVVFDLSKLESLDSTGIGILATCCGKIEASGGEVRLASLQPKVEDLMRLTKLNRILSSHATVAEAIESFRSSPMK
jgi:anti-sigma B factor antagonist